MSFWTGTNWVAEPAAKPPPRPSRTRHILEAVTEGGLIAVLVVGLAAGTTFAAKGGPGKISVPDGAFGGTTTATVNPGGEGTWARAFCYQDGALVYGQYVRVDGNNHATFQLGPTPSWSGGYASCTAEELALRSNGRWQVLAKTTFSTWP